MARMGGVSVACAVLIAVMFSAAVMVWPDPQVGHWLWCLFGGLAVLTLGAVDDVRPLRAQHKLWIHLGIALFLWGGGVRIETVPNPWGVAWSLSTTGSLVVTSLWIVGVTNAMNLIDGLDGLAGLVGLIAATAFVAVAISAGRTDVAVVSAAIVGALAVFLRYNWKPATILLGDSGSLFLGYLLANVGLETVRTGWDSSAAIVPIVILIVPLLDTAYAIVRRLWTRRSPLQRDRGHIHHRLVRAGHTPVQAVGLLACLAVVGALAGVGLSWGLSWEWVLLSGVVGLALVWGIHRMVRSRVLQAGLSSQPDWTGSWPKAGPS